MFQYQSPTRPSPGIKFSVDTGICRLSILVTGGNSVNFAGVRFDANEFMNRNLGEARIRTASIDLSTQLGARSACPEA